MNNIVHNNTRHKFSHKPLSKLQVLLSGGLEPTYSVIIHQDIGGTITATPNEKVKYGSRVNVHITPSSSSYKLKRIGTDPAVSVSGDGNDYSFLMPQSDIILTPN